MSDEPRSLDEIVGDGAVAPEPPIEPEAQPEPETEPQAEGQARDEQGRFAAKAETPEPEPTDQPEPEPEAPRGDGKVPIDALHAERGKNRELRDELSHMRAQMAQLTNTVQQAVPQPKPEVPDFWSDPEGYINHAMQSAVTPMQRALQEQREAASRQEASREFGAERVDAAYQTMGRMAQYDPNVAAAAQRIAQDPHPYAALVKWHEAWEIQNDPETARDRLREELRKEMETQQAQQPAQPQAATPRLPNDFAGSRSTGTRSGPAWTGPKPLGDIFAR